MVHRRYQVRTALLTGLAFFSLVIYNNLPKTRRYVPSQLYNLSHYQPLDIVNVSVGIYPGRAWKPFFQRKDRLGRPDKPRILFWTTITHGWFSELSKNGTAELPYWHQRPGCSHRCYIANDRRTMAVSDAIVFYYCDLNASDFPDRREFGQKWVFWSLESPTNCKMSPLVSWKTAINWTMTYRLDSDVLDTYGTITKKKTPTIYSMDRLRSVWMRKHTMAIWPVSHCNTFGKREHFVEELRKYIRVDVYGRCGNYSSCPQRGTECHRKFEAQYYFLLSFENTVCKDYVTEKLYFTLLFDIIPVTFGGADYKALAPPHSYIDALEFKTPKHLAHYLKAVSEDFDLYKSYFEWKGKYDLRRWEYYTFCNLCAKLYSPSFRETSVYPDIIEWWNGSSQCRAWNRSSKQLS